MIMLAVLAAAITLEGFVLQLADCREGWLPVNSGASVPLDGER